MGALSALVEIWVVLYIVVVFFCSRSTELNLPFLFMVCTRQLKPIHLLLKQKKKCYFKLMPLFCSHCLLRFLSTVLPQLEPLQGAHHCTCVHKAP